MHESEDGRVSGSIDRARVVELYNATDDEELRAHYREVLGESDEGKALDAESVDKPDEAGAQSTSGAPEQPKVSMALSKEQLVEQAKAAGVDDAESKTKAELVEALGGKA